MILRVLALEENRTGVLHLGMSMTCEMRPNMIVEVWLPWPIRDQTPTGMSLFCINGESWINVPRSQFYLTFKATPNLDKKHTVFGKLVGGEEVLDALEALPVKPGTERPAKPVRITEVIM